MATASTSHGRVLHAALYSRVKLVIDKVQKNKESIIFYICKLIDKSIRWMTKRKKNKEKNRNSQNKSWSRGN